MSTRPPLGFSLLAALVLAVPCVAQQAPEVSERPLKPLSRRELDRREALSLYGLAAQHEQRNRLPEALRTCEKALRFDPDSTSILRALVPLYLALDRQQEALDACKRAVELDPEDFDTWFSYSRQLKSLDRDAEARKALARAAVCKGLPDQPETHLNVLFELGLLHEKAKAHREAEAAFCEVIALLERPSATLEQGGMSREELATQVADTYERVGRICLAAGQVDRAAQAFRSAQRRDPARAARLSYNLAEVMVSLKRDAEALVHLDQYLARQPQGIDGYEMKLKLLRRLGRADEALTALEQHAKKDAYNNALHLLLAREYQKAGRQDQAEGVYRKLLVTPTVEVYRGLFDLYKASGRRGVEKLYERLSGAVAAASPDDEKKQARDLDQAAHARAMLGALREDRELVRALLPVAVERILNDPRSKYRIRLLFAALAERTSQLDVAEKLYRSCLDRDGNVADFGTRRQSEAEVYGGLLTILNLGRKHEAIVELCKQGLDHAEATNRVLFHADLASSLLSLGRGKEALESANAAVETAVDKARLGCRQRRAWLLSQLGRHKDAEAECHSLLKEYTNDDEVRGIRLTLSSVYSLAKQNDKAEEQLQKVLEIDPLDAHASNDLGYLWADRNKNLEEAERMIRRAIDLDRQQRSSGDSLGLDAGRDNAAYVDSLGWVLFRRGQIKEACAELEKASRLHDGATDPVVWDHLGDTYFRLKQKHKAAEAWKKSLKLFEERQRLRSDERYRDIQTKLKGL